MLPSRHRFSPRTQEPHFFSSALVYGTSALVVYVAPFAQGKTWQATVIVPKKIASQAVVRNTTKRLLREAVRTQQTLLDTILPPIRLAVVAKPAILNRDLAYISREFNQILQKILHATQ